ncbi:MAG: IS66 family transposase [Mediterranea massiliensis]|nr:IS66 family transposase [Mediterranea massiliensis]
MDLDELQRNIMRIRDLEELESRPSNPYNPSDGMSTDEMSKFIQFIFDQMESVKAELRNANNTIARNAEEQKRSNEEILSLTKRLYEVLQEKDKLLHVIDELRCEIESLKASQRISKKERFGGLSQKGIEKKQDVTGRDDNKGDFDGTSASLPASTEVDAVEDPPSEKHSESRPSRQGRTHSKMSADYQVLHKCDMNQIPSDAIILKTSIRKVFDSVNVIVEHDFEEITYKTADGRIVTSYFPMSDDKESRIYNECVQGTHATANLLSTLAFNRYQMATPAYRELARMVEMKMSVCRQTLINWYGKMADHLTKLIPAMKEEALHEGANVNVDETWCRYQTRFGRKKHYMWCLANKTAKTVIFFYDEGKRNRNVLRDFLGDAKINSLQSDGYNVYMYLDDELHDIEHLCCMAHVRAKFKYAFDQGLDERARYFLEQIAWLYSQERKYQMQNLSPEEIRQARNNDETNRVIAELRKRLDYHLYFDKEPKGDLMQKALNYLHSFWEPLFRYRNDGNYTIDNSLAERSIRPLTVERKNSLFFCSTAGAKASAIFHTIIETCRLLGLSARQYICDFLQAVASGRTDWQNLTPAKLYL